MDEQKPIFLNTGNILSWDRPLPPGCFSMLHMYNGSTKLKEFLGFENQNQQIGPYHVTATAAKYLADIAKNKGVFIIRRSSKSSKRNAFIFRRNNHL